MKIRVGMGFDTHVLLAGKTLWLGGVNVPAGKGTVGHSDADVLIHALCDALLGAAGLGDIGVHFPDTDMQWKGKASKFFLKETVRMLKEEGWHIENADCTVCLESPRISPHVPAIKKTLAPIMEIEERAFSVKATTNERLGYVGRKEGVNAYAVALISKK